MRPKSFLFSLPFLITSLVFAPHCCAQEPKEKAILKGHESEVRSLAFSPDGKTLASGAFGQRVKGDESVGVIKLWDLSTGKESATLTDHTASVEALVFTKDSKNLVSGSADNTVKVWDLSTGKATKTFEGHTHTVRALALASDGKTLASGSSDATIRLWDLPTGKEIRTLKTKRHPNDIIMGVNTMAFSPDGSLLASGGWGRSLKLWSTDTGEELFTLKGHSSDVTSLAFAPDGKTSRRE